MADAETDRVCETEASSFIYARSIAAAVLFSSKEGRDRTDVYDFSSLVLLLLLLLRLSIENWLKLAHIPGSITAIHLFSDAAALKLKGEGGGAKPSGLFSSLTSAACHHCHTEAIVSNR